MSIGWLDTMLTSANYGQNYDWMKSMIILNHTWLELLEMSMCVNCFHTIYMIKWFYMGFSFCHARKICEQLFKIQKIKNSNPL